MGDRAGEGRIYLETNRPSGRAFHLGNDLLGLGRKRNKYERTWEK
jgi:hypothetical protein